MAIPTSAPHDPAATWFFLVGRTPNFHFWWLAICSLLLAAVFTRVADRTGFAGSGDGDLTDPTA